MTKAATISDRDRERWLRQQDRALVKGLQFEVTRLKREQSKHKVETRKQRRKLLRDMRQDLSTIPRRDRAHRAERLRQWQKDRESFRVWWESVLQQRARRRAALEETRRELRDLRTTAKARIAEALAVLRGVQGDELARFDRDAKAKAEWLSSELLAARTRVFEARRDQKQMARTKREVTSRKRARTTKRERWQEYSGGVESNLTTAEEHAIWRREKGLILSMAKARGIKAPDAIAELVRERAEADPDRALEFVADDADAWLAAELRKQGY